MYLTLLEGEVSQHLRSFFKFVRHIDSMTGATLFAEGLFMRDKVIPFCSTSFQTRSLNHAAADEILHLMSDHLRLLVPETAGTQSSQVANGNTFALESLEIVDQEILEASVLVLSVDLTIQLVQVASHHFRYFLCFGPLRHLDAATVFQAGKQRCDAQRTIRQPCIGTIEVLVGAIGNQFAQGEPVPIVGTVGFLVEMA